MTENHRYHDGEPCFAGCPAYDSKQPHAATACPFAGCENCQTVPDLPGRDLTTIAEMGISDIHDLLAEMLDWASDCWGPENGMPAEPSDRWLVITVRNHYHDGLAGFLADYRSWYPEKVR